MFATACNYAIAAATSVEEPTVSYDLGLVVGRGIKTFSYESRDKALASWTRTGPELVASVLPTPNFTVGIGFGFQVGYYDKVETIRRNEYSVRPLVRYRLPSQAPFTHGISVFISVVVSKLAAESSLYETFPGARSRSGHFGFGASYLFGRRFSRGWIAGIELGIAGFPNHDVGSLEGIVRPHVIYEF